MNDGRFKAFSIVNAKIFVDSSGIEPVNPCTKVKDSNR